MKNRIAYIVTANNGLPAFVYKEIDDVNKSADLQIIPYVMRRGKGLYMPKQEWGSRYWNFFSIFFGAIIVFFSKPHLFIKALVHSFYYLSIIDFLISLGFYNNLIKDKPTKILAFEGLHAIRIAYFTKILTQINYSVIVHAEMLRVSNTFFPITKRALDECEHIISPTKLNCKKISEKFNVKLNKIMLNRMSVDLDRFQEDNRFKILIVGYYNSRKGHETLLKALEYLNDPEIVVWIAGNDIKRGDYFDVKSFVDQKKLNKSVRILGGVSDEVLHVLLNSCDIFSLPCQTPKSGIVEGLPVSLMEAMAYGKTVLSTFHTGIPELVMDSLVKEGDFISLAIEILKYKNSRNLMNKVGQKNRKIIEDKFSNNNISLIKKVLGN
tara:strand:+ start:13867 stop:15009 length:1143 start_codon:yes stop_codon:yes gene_type:complete